VRWGALVWFGRLRHERPALVATLCAVLALGSPVAAATAPETAATTGTVAVVLVSGFTTTTPFTTPQAQCRGTYARGATWTYDGGRYAAAGYNVYTAPVADGAGPVTPDPPLFHNCPAQLPRSMTINSRGDIYANAQALASFVAYLHTKFGVSTVRIVAHSYGGLWTRGALRLAARAFPAVRVRSITTLGTPHLGSFLADVGEGVDPALCGSDLTCKLIADLLVAYREARFEPALSQVTAASVAQWNPGQGRSLNGIPLTAVAGDAVTLPGISNPYVSPDDVLIGIESAQAVGLDRAGVIPELSCFSPFPDVHSNTFLPFFPAVKHSLLSDPGIVTDVEQTLAGNPPASRCPNPALPATPTTSTIVSGASGREMTVPLRSVARELSAGLPRASNGDAIIFLNGTQLTCRGRPLGSVPFVDSIRLRVIPQPTCNGQIRVRPKGAGMLYLRHSADSLTLRLQRGRVFVHLHGPGSAGRLVVATKRGHHFLTVSLDRQKSLRVARGARTVTLRVELSRGRGAGSELAVVTIHP
jgi:triacylglycerol lipase